jgi:hypothetical protein
MKKLTLLFAVIILMTFTSSIIGQGIPETINYQGILKDAGGVLVPNGDYNLTFKLYNVESGGTSIWSETKLIAVVSGIVNTQLGSVNPIPQATFNAAAWLGITVAAGSELTPRIALTSVPYSIYSLNVPDGSITSTKIADDEVVKSVNGLKDNVNLVAGSNVTITPSGNNLTISSTGGGGGTIGGSGSANYLPLFTSSTILGNSNIYQTANGNIGIGTINPQQKLHINGLAQFDLPTGQINLSTPGGNPGIISFAQNGNRRDLIFNNFGIQLFTGSSPAAPSSGISIFDNGNVGIGAAFLPSYPLHVATNRKIAGYFTSDSLSDFTKVLTGEYLGVGNSDAAGVYGLSTPSDGYGLGGYFVGGYMGVRAVANGGSYTGSVYGVHSSTTGNIVGTKYGIYSTATGGTVNWAGYFAGNVNVTGTLSKASGSFKIDHPLDPTNKNLYHSFVESPDMMNIYNGNVVTDASGNATITMPDWFEALNRDFRYQLTVIGDFAQAIVSQKIQNNQFIIRTDKPNIEVSWQVTGIRHDKFAEKNRIPVEENKRPEDIGKYLHPDAYGVSETLGVDYENNRIDKEHKK